MGTRVAFIGLGVMGAPMAGHLARAGHQVTVFNRTTATAERWVERHGGRAAPSPSAAARDAEVAFVCVGNDDDVRAVTTGAGGVLDGLPAGAVLVDHTTTSARLARELDAAARDRQVGFVDAPVSGGQVGAERGQLTVMCGGTAEDVTRIEPLVRGYARMVRRIGPVGSGQMAKMVNQICIAGLVQGLAEALHFARRAGLDAAAVIDVISKGAAQSWQMENRWQTMLEGRYDFGFAVDWMRKDLAIVLEEARQNGAHLPVAALVDQFYGEVQELGGGRWDTSSLLARLEAMRRRS
jgi:3-hydroxyisobutyrate dehydrogenase-like beta-hydroxyacid dehydrogenase